MENVIAIEFKGKQGRVVCLDGISALQNIVSEKDFNEYSKLLQELELDYLSTTKGIIGVNTICMRKYALNRENLNLFMAAYSDFLYKAFTASPLDFALGYTLTLNNMAWAIVSGTFNKDSDSFKKTCKQLGIKHTYKAIDEFLGRSK